jgi:aspartate kinase
MGATVLHEDAIFPVRFAGIPINIRNTNNPEAKGTMIVATSTKDDGHGVITGIAGKRGFSTVTVEKDMMNAEVGFGRKLLEVFENNNVCFEHLPSGIDTMSVVVSSAELYKDKDKVLNGIFKAVTPDSMTVEDNIALIAIVGRGMVEAKGTASRIFKAISDADINIKMIDQGSSELSIIIGITEDDFEKALRAIYAEFCL